MIQRFFGTRVTFLLTFLTVTAVLAGTSFWVISFVWNQVGDEEEIAVESALSAIYIDYYNNADEYVSQDSYLAMAAYVQQIPQPQNVRVLVDMPTSEIVGYMLNHFSAGLGVNCTYCHTLENFAADVWDDEVAMANKNTARIHLQMSADLNQQWLTQLASLTDDKQPSGSQISCATCHNGVAQPAPWPENQTALPDDFRLPLDSSYVFGVDVQSVLKVNARDDISLDTVQYNQNVMYHMNTSLGVGCTHCHNSRYFPSWEDVPAKYYALNMLQMSQFIWNEYGDALGGNQPSCNMCHQGAAIPPGAVRSADLLPAALVGSP